MKAVNLIPVEERRGGAGAPGRTGQAPYFVLGALALAVVLLAATALSARSVSGKRDKVASLQAQLASEKTSADRLQTYVQLGAQRDERTKTVSGLVKARFDWASVMREVARTLPKGASLMSLDGSGGTAQAASASTPGVTASAAPTLKVSGCTANQSDVALMLVDLRRMNGVESVALDTTAKADAAGGASTDSGSGGDCRAGSDQRPQFTVTITFRAPVAPAAAAAAATAGTATTASGTAPTTTTTPSTEAAK